MQNCRVKLLKRIDTLKDGHRSGHTEAELWSGPAHFSAPRRSWEQQAALEQMLSGTLIVHTPVSLASVTTAVVTDRNGEVEYEVLGASYSGMTWTVTLGRRAAHGIPATG